MTTETPIKGSEQPDIIVSGHLCVDLIVRLNTLSAATELLPGHLYEVGPMEIALGGCASNTALALRKLGANVRIMSNVGDDQIGGIILNILRGVDPALAASIKVQQGSAGSFTVVLNPTHAERTFIHGAGTNTTFGPEYIDFGQVAHAKLFHLGYPPLLPRLIQNEGELLRQIFQQAKAAGAVTSMDMVMADPDGPTARANWPAIFKKTLPYVDIFIPTIEEMVLMARRKDYEVWKPDILSHLTAAYLYEFAGELIEMGVAVAGFKLGHFGFYLRTADAARIQKLDRLPLDPAQWANQTLWHPAFQVEVAGTTGAGDSAYGALLAAMLRGWSPAEAVRWACAVGACNVEAADSSSGVRSWAATQQRLDAGWPTRPERLAGM